jgi:hypothetical protein
MTDVSDAPPLTLLMTDPDLYGLEIELPAVTMADYARAVADLEAGHDDTPTVQRLLAAFTAAVEPPVGTWGPADQGAMMGHAHHLAGTDPDGPAGTR